MEMYDFFHDELKTLKARTGILQWEKLNECADPGKEINELIDFMIVEVNRPPFDNVKPEVRQRVISRAIVEDKDFIGLNAKFVRRALNAWWDTNGDRVLMAMNEKQASVYEKVKLTPEQDEQVSVMLESYWRRLLAEGSAMKTVPKMEKKQFEKEGAEWKSELERESVARGIRYSTPEDHARYDLHLQYLRENHDILTGDKLPTWIPETEWLKQNGTKT